MTVFEFPPSESCRRRVSFELRYGMCCDLPSTSDEMTLPRVDRDKLILVASFNRWPVAPVFDCRSDPYIYTDQIYSRYHMTKIHKLLRFLMLVVVDCLANSASVPANSNYMLATWPTSWQPPGTD